MKLKIAVLFVVLLMVFCTGTALAEGYDSGTKEMTIDINNWTTGSLNAKVISLLGASGDTPADVLTLVISAGDLNAADGDYIDDSMTGLTTLAITTPATMATPSDTFFRDDAVIESITLPVVVLGNNMFRNCDAMHTLILPNATTFNNNCIQGNDGLTTLSLPSATSFNNTCLRGNDALLSYTFDNDVSFNNDCFVNHDILTTITINGNASFNNGCITDNAALTDINITGNISFNDECITDNPALVTLSLPGSGTFGRLCIMNNALLTTVTMNNVTAFDDQAFRDNPSLTTVSLDNVQTFENQAFRYSPVDNVSFPQLVSVGNRFMDSTDATNVYAPMLTSLGENVFNGVTNVVTFELGSTVPTTVDPIAFTAYDPENMNAVLRVPFNQVDDYDAAEGPVDDGMWYGWTLQGVIRTSVTQPAANPTTGDDGIYIPYTLLIGLLVGGCLVFGFIKMKKQKV